MLKDLFYESLFTIQYILEKKIIATTLANTYATRYDFIGEKFIETVCHILEMKS